MASSISHTSEDWTWDSVILDHFSLCHQCPLSGRGCDLYSYDAPQVFTSTDCWCGQTPGWNVGSWRSCQQTIRSHLCVSIYDVWCMMYSEISTRHVTSQSHRCLWPDFHIRRWRGWELSLWPQFKTGFQHVSNHWIFRDKRPWCLNIWHHWIILGRCQDDFHRFSGHILCQDVMFSYPSPSSVLIGQLTNTGLSKANNNRAAVPYQFLQATPGVISQSHGIKRWDHWRGV